MDKSELEDAARLRQKAEEIAAHKVSVEPGVSSVDAGKLVHELEVHQIELELQNEELRRAQGELQISRDRYADLFEFAPVAYFIMDRHRRITAANLTASQLIGIERAYLSGQRFSVFVLPESQDILYRFFKDSPVKSEIGCELAMRRGDGTPFYAELRMVKEEAVESSVTYLLAVVDITERKQSEESLRRSRNELQAIYEGMFDGILIADVATRRFLKTNPAMCRMLGYSETELLSMSLMDIHPSPALPVMLERLQAAIEGRLTTAENAPLLRKDGTTIYADIGSVHITYIGRPCLIGFFHDITERKKIEDELRESRNQLELRVQERTRELSESLRNLHEEVAQRRFAEESLMHRSEQLRRLARELTLTEQRERQQLAYLLHDGLQQILVGAKYRLALAARSQNAPDAFNEVTELIDDAIKTSRSLTAELSPTILQQKELIPALEWLGRWMHEKHRFRLSLKAPERIPPLAEEMLLLLFQSARELLFNVVKHAGVRTARIDLDWRNSRLFMTVEDKGAGFDPNSLPFEEAKSGGIGLFNLKERLSHVGGQMEIESAPGQGSRFILSVPLPEVSAGTGRPAGEKARVSAQPSRDAEAQQAGKGNRIRVMLVDDHLVLRQGLNGMIQREPDMEVAGEASNGESAVILCREIHPDVILMDISMTGMDGIEATRIIHGEFPEVRIIGLSMFQEERTRAAMCEAGAVGYVTKSGPSETLLETIRTCAGTHPSA